MREPQNPNECLKVVFLHNSTSSESHEAMHKLSNHCKTLLEQQVEEEGEAEGLLEP